LLALAMAGMAYAQTPAYQFGMLQQSFAQTTLYFPPRGDDATPCARAFRKNRVAALRREIIDSVAESGGRLSDQEQRSISRKICAIVGYTGSFALADAN
jgi:hypothetical protein